MLARLGTLALVKDSSADIERALKAKQGMLTEAQNRLEKVANLLLEGDASETIGRTVRQIEIQVKTLEKECDTLKSDLAAEQSIGWNDFLERLDLVSYAGRDRANTLLKRRGIVVLIGPSGYAVTENGHPLFAMDYREGEAGYLLPGGFARLPTFLPVSEVQSHADAEDAYHANPETLESEGHPWPPEEY
jgi:hypothetical protein